MIRRKVATALLFMTPAIAFAGGDSITIHVGGCQNADLSADVIHAADQNANYLKEMAVSITVDEKKRRCGYELQKGKKVRRLKSGLTDIELHGEIARFFGEAPKKP